MLEMQKEKDGMDVAIEEDTKRKYLWAQVEECLKFCGGYVGIACSCSIQCLEKKV